MGLFFDRPINIEEEKIIKYVRATKNSARETDGNNRFAINSEITASEVRVVSEGGGQLGILPLSEAISMAEEKGLDLVEVAPNATPPVCRILDYGKLKYKEQKKAAEARKKSSVVTIKELRLRYNTDQHDLETKVCQARKFLDSGDKVKFQMRFRGREVVYKEFGENIFNVVAQMLEDVAEVEERTPLIGNRMLIIFVPKT